MNSKHRLSEKLWERHKNPFSWYIRPLFGALVLYGSWEHNFLLITSGLIGITTSWFWFPPPKEPHPLIERFIEIEKEYISPPYTYNKMIGIMAVAIFVPLVMYLFWLHEYKWGLALFAVGALLKSVWSLVVARQAGIKAAVIGFITFVICIILIHAT